MGRPRRYGERLVGISLKVTPTQKQFLDDHPNGAQFVRDQIDKAILDSDKFPQQLASDKMIEVDRKITEIESNPRYQLARKWCETVGEKSAEEIKTDVLNDLKDWRPSLICDGRIMPVSWRKNNFEVEDDRANDWFNSPSPKTKEMYDAIAKVIIENIEKHRPIYRAYAEKLVTLKRERNQLAEKLKAVTIPLVQSV